MAYSALGNVKKNSPGATLTADITAVQTTIPVSNLEWFHDIETGALITKGIVIGYDSSVQTRPEEIIITGASGTSGAGNLTGASRGVNADGTIGAGYAWGSGTYVAVMFSTGIYNRIRDNIAAIYAALSYGYKELTVLQGTVPDTNPATLGQGPELANGVNYAWASFNHSALQRFMWVIPMPADWDGTLKAIIGWTSLSAGSGTVKWDLKGLRVADGGTLNATLLALANATDTFQGASIPHYTAETSSFSPSGSGNLLFLELNRDYATDTLADDARFICLWLKVGRTV